MKRYRWIVGFLAVVLVLSGCGASKARVQGETGTVATPDSEQERPTPPPALPAGRAILMDGELVTVYPAMQLAFSGNVNAKVKTLDVEIGQRITDGHLIATLDDADLQQAVADAQLTLDRAQKDLAQAQTDAEIKYQEDITDAETKYQDELEDAEDKYESELENAQDALRTAQVALQRAKMQPPTTAVQEAKVNLGQTLEAEADAEDNYKQALDRPWEPQSIRDSYFKEWQRRIVDRQLAELRLQDAEVSLEVYYFDLRIKEQDVQKAQEDLAKVEMDQVEMDDVDREDDFTTYERAVEDAERQLVDAQADLDNIYLYAPWDGLVLSIDTNVGAMVSSGTTIVTLLNVEDLYFITQNLSERHVAQIAPGQQANITLRTFPDTVVTGRVETIVPQIDRKADADARFTAYIRLTDAPSGDDADLDLLPGMTGRVEVVTEDE